MVPTDLTIRIPPQRQMRAARQLRAETVVRGLVRGIEGALGVIGRVVARRRWERAVSLDLSCWTEQRTPTA